MRLLAILLILVPTIASAEMFELYNESSYGMLSADEREGGTISGAHNGYGYPGYVALWVGGDIYQVVDGRLDVVSGPFISERIEPPDTVFSNFAAGGTVQATWVIALPDGGTREVRFSAELGPFDLVYHEDEEDFGAGLIVPFQYGRIDQASAEFLGLPSHGLAGDWNFWLDHLSHLDRGPDYRRFTMAGIITATEVPEPSLAILLLAGLVARKWRVGRTR